MGEVKLTNITKVYEGIKPAVNNVSFTVNDKEFVVLVGPSGCGKSTTLRMIAGLEEVSEGEIFIDNRLVNDIPPKDRDIAMVFQNYALYPHMSVYENLSFGLKIRKLPKNEIDNRVKEAAKILDIEDYLERKPKALSGGQRQRVAVGRAIVRKPKVFLFDEPLSNLDAKLRVQMRTEISKLHHKLGATMIYVTHDQTEAMTMGDRIVVMKDGFIQQIDTPLNLYNKPVNKFVAGFIGSPAMNFLNVKIESSGKLFAACTNGFKFLLSDEISENIKSHIEKELILGIRPEDIIVNEIKNGLQDENVISIDVVEPLGNESLIYFRINNEQFVARIKPDSSIVREKKYMVEFNPGKIHLFSISTEERNVYLKKVQ